MVLMSRNCQIGQVKGLFNRELDAVKDGIGSDGFIVTAPRAAFGKLVLTIEVLLVPALLAVVTTLPFNGLQEAIAT